MIIKCIILLVLVIIIIGVPIYEYRQEGKKVHNEFNGYLTEKEVKKILKKYDEEH